MRPINYLEIDYIYNRIATEIQEIVAEDRITEWVGEVMEFIRTPLKQEKGIYVLKVDNWQAEFPRGLHTLINVARFNGCLPQNLSLCCGEEKEQTEHKYHSHTHHHTCTSCTPPSNTETINNSQNEDNIINTILPFVVKKNKSIAGGGRMLMMGGNPYKDVRYDDAGAYYELEWNLQEFTLYHRFFDQKGTLQWEKKVESKEAERTTVCIDNNCAINLTFDNLTVLTTLLCTDEENKTQNNYDEVLKLVFDFQLLVLNVYSSLEPTKRREVIIGKIAEFLKTDILSVYTIFLPNAFDGLDAEFKDKIGSTKEGQFAIEAYLKADGEIEKKVSDKIEDVMERLSSELSITEYILPSVTSVDGTYKYGLIQLPIIEPKTQESIGVAGIVFKDTSCFYNATSLLCFNSAIATQPLNLENIETSSTDIRIKFRENIVFGVNPHVEIYTDNCLGGSHVGHIYHSSMWIDNNDTLVIHYPPNNHPNFSFSNSFRIKITENTILGQDFVLEWTVFKQDSINPVKPINVYPAAFSSVPVYTDYVDVTFNSSITPVSLQNPNGIKMAESNTLPSVNVRDFSRDPEMISNDTIRFYIHNLQPEKFYTVFLNREMIVEMGGEDGKSPYALSWCFSTKSCPISFYTLTVHYLSATNHSEVAASYVENLESGQDYSVLSPDLTSQYLYTDQPVVSGFMPEEDLDIQVFYWEEGQCIGSDIQVLNINLITSSSFETAHVVIKFNYELNKNFPLTTNDITIQGGKKPATINFNNIQYESNQCSIAIENLEADTEYFIEIEPNVFSAAYLEKPYLCYIQFSFKTKKKKTDYECDCKDPCDCCNDFIFIQHPYIPLNLAVTEENKEIEFLRVANRPYFESDPCMGIKNTSCRHEYSIVGTTERQFRLSFESGYILVSGYQIALDKRGLPLIIDMPDVINAIIYYIKWKVSEFKWMNEPTVQQSHLVQYNRQMYEKYCKQSKTALKMPHGVDDYKDLLEFQNRISTDSFYYTFFNRTIKLK